MRLNLVLAGAAVIMAASMGCDRPPEKSDRKPVEFSLNPHSRSISIGGEGIGPRTKDRTELMYTSRSSKGAQGEWPLAGVVATHDKEDNPQVVVRVFDATRGAVRVEAKFTGPKVITLSTIAFPHVTKSEGFTLKTAKGESAYSGHREKGEDLLLDWPGEGDGTVTFLAWPHVH